MRIQTTLGIGPPDSLSSNWLTQFFNIVNKLYQAIASAIDGNIGFGDGNDSDNIDGVWAQIVTPIAPNTDFVVTHGLGRIPVGYWAMTKSAACDIYTGSVAGTINQITLRASVGSVHVSLFIV